jgi:tRNA modification GTPase
MTNIQDTIVALATVPGHSALGVIRMSGFQALTVASKLLHRSDFVDVDGYTVHYGKIRDENKRILDEVIVTVFRDPKSFTGEDIVEISCHGSPYILQEIIALCTRYGCRLAMPGEFSMRAFLNGKMDLTQAEAIADLIASGSARAHSLAMNQLRGGFSIWISQLRNRLIKFASLIELELDFSEEDVQFADRDALLNLMDEMISAIRPLIESFKYGNAIRNGVTTVLAGRPNAGKSTLLNALLNEERAIVSEIAGTTRDTIEESLIIDGVQFRLIDTAGLREATDQIESIGISRTLEKINESAILLYIFDVTELTPQDLWSDLQKLSRPGLQMIIVGNKMDLNPYIHPEDYYIEDLISKENIVMTAAIHQMNIPYLKERLSKLVLEQELNTESTIIQNVRHVHALESTIDSLLKAQSGIESGISGEFVAQDIRGALYHLGTITGVISSDMLLESIFRDFCIGK